MSGLLEWLGEFVYLCVCVCVCADSVVGGGIGRWIVSRRGGGCRRGGMRWGSRRGDRGVLGRCLR